MYYSNKFYGITNYNKMLMFAILRVADILLSACASSSTKTSSSSSLSSLFADHIQFNSFVVLPQQLLTDGAKRVIKRPPAGWVSIKKAAARCVRQHNISHRITRRGKNQKSRGGKEEWLRSRVSHIHREWMDGFVSLRVCVLAACEYVFVFAERNEK